MYYINGTLIYVVKITAGTGADTALLKKTS